MRKKLLVIGGGFGGCTAIHLFSQLTGWDITLVHPSPELGGGVRTRFRSGHPYTFGPRHFLTQNNKVYEYLNSKIPLRLCKEHQFISFVDDDSQFYNYPIHMDDIERMPERVQIHEEINNLQELYKNASFKLTTGEPRLEAEAKDYEDFWIKSIGPTLYKKFVERYTKKMWMIDDNKTIDDFSWSPKGVAIKKGPKEGRDTAISAYPLKINGYNDYFDSAKELCDNFIVGEVKNVVPNELKVEINDEIKQYDMIINTAPLDDLFNNSQGSLRYIGRSIEFVVLPVEFSLPKSVYFAYYTGSEKYTRVVEYKKFSQYSSPHTLISLEYPDATKGKYYPMPTEEFRSIHKRYLNLCHDDMHSIGRIAKYNYRYDIDDVIEQAIDLAENI